MYTLYPVKENEEYSASTFDQLFVDALMCMFWAEKQQLVLLRRAEKAASTKYLKASFKGHLLATVNQVNRISEMFKLIDRKPRSRKCYEMEALTIEIRAVIKATEKNTLSRDMGLILLAKKIEHLEIKKYNKLINIANDLGNFSLVNLLDECLVEEQEAEETFSAVMEDTQRDEMFKIDGQEENAEEEILEAV